MNQRADTVRILTERGIEHVKIGVFDGDGVLRGKYLCRDKFLSALDKNLGFCDVILGWDSNDQLYDNTKFTGWHTAYPDATVRILPATAPRHPVRAQDRAVSRRICRPRRSRSARAARCGACSSAPQAWATR